VITPPLRPAYCRLAATLELEIANFGHLATPRPAPVLNRLAEGIVFAMN
jgi:hypothetical protein